MKGYLILLKKLTCKINVNLTILFVIIHFLEKIRIGYILLSIYRNNLNRIGVFKNHSETSQRYNFWMTKNLKHVPVQCDYTKLPFLPEQGIIKKKIYFLVLWIFDEKELISDIGRLISNKFTEASHKQMLIFI